jgi:hypothetical protein
MTVADGALPAKSGGILSDIKGYFFTRPPIPTLIEFPSMRERVDYSKRILQRLAVDVDPYSVLNIHRIGIDAPVKDVFEAFFSEDMEARCWPDHVAHQRRPKAGVEEIHVVGFGGMQRFHAAARTLFGDGFGTLFRMTLLRAQHSPDSADLDNVRYLLYRCDGGYPVGILGIYVRSPLPQLGEVGTSQFFFVVGFNFYGHRGWRRIRVLNRMWEGVHNRVTVNVLNRFKRLCEVRFEETQRELEIVFSSAENTSCGPNPVVHSR